MSVAAPLLPPPLREGDRLTSDEFMRRWEAMPGLKFAELIDGVVQILLLFTLSHGRIDPTLSWWLNSYVAATPG